jgi:hypothetical protein
MTDRHTIILSGGVLAFAIVLAIAIGTRLETPVAQAIGLGVAAGVIAGMIGGIVTTLLILRRGNGGWPSSEARDGILLTEEQTDALFMLLEGQPVSSAPSPLRTRRNREFSAVGGAHLPDQQDEE